MKPKSFDYITDKSKLGTIICIVLLVWVSLSVVIFFALYFGAGEQRMGLIGDSFGWVNSLFSSLAFAGLYYTIMLQKKELYETRQEFRQQNETLKQQRFEGFFFNMVTVHFKITENIGDAKSGFKGMHYLLNVVFPELDRSIGKIGLAEPDKRPTREEESELCSRFSDVYNKHSIYIASYLNSLSELYLCIKRESFSKDDEYRYILLLNSYISPPERVFLYYYLIIGPYENARHTLREFDFEMEDRQMWGPTLINGHGFFSLFFNGTHSVLRRIVYNW